MSEYKRDGDVNEWFDLSASEILEKFSDVLPVLRAAVEPDPIEWKGSQRFYDDWRDLGKSHATCRWHIWIFQDMGPDRNLKLSVSSLFDTQFTYSFTYNPYPVRLVGAFEHAEGIDEIGEGNVEANLRLVETWKTVMTHFGRESDERVGWLPVGVSERDLMRVFADHDVRLVSLDRPKPDFVRKRDPSVNPCVPVGAVPPQRRVNALFDQFSLEPGVRRF